MRAAASGGPHRFTQALAGALAGALAMLVAAVPVGSALAQPVAARTAAPSSLKHVLVLDTWAPHRPVILQWLEGIHSVLDTVESPAPTVFVEGLDMARLSWQHSIDRQTAWLLAKYAAVKIDLIIALNMDSADIAQQLRSAWGRDVPLVALWYQADRPTRSTVRPRIANGVPVLMDTIERPVMRHMRQLLPGLREVLVVGGTSTEAAMLAAMVAHELGDAVRVEPIGPPSLPALRTRFATLSPNAALLLGNVTRDADGRSWIGGDFLRELSAITPRPIFSYVPTYVGAGIVGGPLVDLRQQGAAMASLGVQLVRGVPATAIPPMVFGQTRVVYDWAQLRRFDIPRARLTRGATFINRPIPVWERYPAGTTMTAVLVLALATGLGLVVRRGRQLRQSQAERLAITQRLLRMQDEERVRIANDLHDDLCQEMTVLALEVQRTHHTALSPADVSARIRHLTDRARDVARGLHAGHLGQLYLPDAIAAHAADLQARTGLSIHVTAPAWTVTPSPDVAVALYRSVQEALQNVLKHADATVVTVQLDGDGGTVRIDVTDDGIGFSPDRMTGGGQGLGIMRERLASIGGLCTIRATPFEGTRVTLTVPVTPAAIR